MFRHAISSAVPPLTVSPLPAWARAKAQSSQAVDAPYLAGASLAALDPIARASPLWAGVWRQRLALQAATASLRLIGRRDDQSQLRDVHLLRRPGEDPGPAGRVLLAWRELIARSPDTSEAAIARTATGFGLALSASDLASLADLAGEAIRSGRTAIVVVGALTEGAVRLRPDAELLAFWLADAVLAHKLKWPVPVPLLVSAILEPGLRIGLAGKRPRPGREGWQQALALAYAQAAGHAIDLASELARRAEGLEAVAPKLRAKGAGAVIAALLNEDALTASSELGGLSDRGSRRLFDRLVALGAVRELSGRPTFRIYGL